MVFYFLSLALWADNKVPEFSVGAAALSHMEKPPKGMDVSRCFSLRQVLRSSCGLATSWLGDPEYVI